MNQAHRFLPLALVTLLVACGVGSDGTTNLRPTPSAVKPEAQQPTTAQAENDPNPWYQHHDVSEVVVRISPDALTPDNNPELSITEAGGTPLPTRIAYARRIQTLQQARERLLRENAALTMKLTLQPEQPVDEELGTLRTQLGHLSTKQRLVTAKTQAVAVEHQALLAMLEQRTADANARVAN